MERNLHGCLLCFFFFQAEDGIRDFCLSRGLGDVYERQDYEFDAYTPLWNYSAWTSNGTPVRFVREKTNAEIAVYDSCEDIKRSEGKNEESRKASK